MVAKELLDELQSIRRDFDWTYDGRNRRIRAKLKSQPDGQLFDPIGAVCYSRTGLLFGEENWFRAAEEIGLSHIDAGDITAAANSTCKDQRYIQDLRRQMIHGLLLQPEYTFDTEVPKGFMGYISVLFGEDSDVTTNRV